MQCHNITLIPCHNILPSRWLTCAYLGLNRCNDFIRSGRVVSTLVVLCVYLGFDRVWSYNLTIITCENVLQRRWSAESMKRWNDIAGSARTDGCIPVFDFGVVIGVDTVWVHALILISCHTILQIAMVGVQLSWWHRWHDPVGPGRIGRTFVFLKLFCGFDPADWGHNLTLILFTIYFDGDGWRAFILVASMARSRWPWTNRTYVCIAVCLAFKVQFWF